MKKPAVDENSLRLISSTNFLSKVYEAFLWDWLLPYISPFLDKNNYGGMKNSSTIHYLLNLINFVHENADQTEPHAVVLAQADLEKAFNSVSHILVIEDLHDMSVPPFLLNILVSFLTRRNFTLRFNGKESRRHFLQGSSPQGIFLGVLIFLVKFNGAFLRPKIPRVLLREDNSALPEEFLIDEPCHQKNFTAKYVDDSCKAVAFNLKSCLTLEENLERPLVYHQRTGHALKENHNSLQFFLSEFSDFARDNLFRINHQKSSIMFFNFSHAWSFLPRFNVGADDLEVVRSTKLLGVFLNDQLRWNTHVEYICAKARKRIWILRRLMDLDLDSETILDIYFKEIRSILEYASVVFHSGLTKKQSDALESVQKLVLRLLTNYLDLDLSINEAYIYFMTEPLEGRRVEACKTFIKRTLNNPIHSYMFKEYSNCYTTQNNFWKFQVAQARTTRHKTSPLIYLSNLANEMKISK